MKKKLSLFIYFVFIYQMAICQKKIYFGSYFNCGYFGCFDGRSYLILKKNKTFESHNFNKYYKGKEKCKKIEGKWSIKNDTLYISDRKELNYFYRVKEDSLIVPDYNSLIKIFKSEKKLIDFENTFPFEHFTRQKKKFKFNYCR